MEEVGFDTWFQGLMELQRASDRAQLCPTLLSPMDCSLPSGVGDYKLL